ncbi:11202_t:CDS:2 [Ambispora gerdemannii]|uniref:11202_t:CDS:1 n=1 Tax=Ambispora gerdemannii TaxID=144530 RepID=A0A9N8W341_9GLOM|nr:11202_t:CDS:2 [Ambispora gerdemannii]
MKNSNDPSFFKSSALWGEKNKTPKPTEEDKERKKKVVEEIKRVVKEGDKPSDVKRKVIDFKNSIGLTQSQKLYNFACELCEQYRRQERRNFHRLDGLALDPNKLYIICDTCIETGRANIVKERDTEYDPIK